MNHNLIINLIPYRTISNGIDLHFTNEPSNGLKIAKKWAPSEVEEIKADSNGNLYWSLDPLPKSTKVFFEFFNEQRDDKNRRHFVKKVFTHLLYKHFKSQGFVIGASFVGDVRVWIRVASQPTGKPYIVYDKFSLKVDLDTFGKGYGVFLSYDGKSSVTSTPVKELKMTDTGCIGKVICSNEVYSRKHEDFPKHTDDCLVVFNRHVEKALNVTIDKTRPLNKYREYHDKIKEFYNAYLSGKSICGCFEILTTGFLPVPEDGVISSVNEESNLLQFKDNVRNVSVYDGLKRAGGPYFVPDLSAVRFIFMFMENDRDVSNKLFSFLNKGYKNFPGLEKYVSVPFTLDLTKSLRIKNEETIVDEVESWLNETNFESDKKYFVIYISPISKNEDDSLRHSIYFKIKELLLEKEISSQVVFKDHLGEENFNYYLPNIAVAILAKLGGVPWRLPYPLKEDLVIGIGVHRDLESDSAFIGNAICFRNDGQFEGFKVFPSNDIIELSTSLKKSICDFRQVAGGCKRIVVHYYKNIGRDERVALDVAMKELELDIPYVFVTVRNTETKDYVVFDNGFEGRIPTSGTIVKLRYNEFLLCNNTRYKSNTGQKLLGYPFPIKINIFSHPKELAKDFVLVRDILDQVYEFSRIYWKSVLQRSKPVTIEYSEIIAEIVSQFNSKRLPNTKAATSSLWFL